MGTATLPLHASTGEVLNTIYTLVLNSFVSPSVPPFLPPSLPPFFAPFPPPPIQLGWTTFHENSDSALFKCLRVALAALWTAIILTVCVTQILCCFPRDKVRGRAWHKLLSNFWENRGGLQSSNLLGNFGNTSK